MEYKIVSADAVSGRIEVEYMEAEIHLGVYAIDVPIVNGVFLNEEELDAEILLRAPLWVNARENEVASASGFEYILSLAQPAAVLKEKTEEELQAAKENLDMWALYDYERKLALTLIKWGIMSNDPTGLPVATL
jgi:hypothetical protein